MPLRFALAAALVALLAFSGCRTDTSPSSSAPATSDRTVVYTGRAQALVDRVVQGYREQAGREVEVRYGRDAELLATLQEEGARSPAGVFWANTAGALGAASNAGLLTSLPDSLLGRPASFVPSSGQWVPVTVRFRVLAYNPERVDPASLPTSAMDLPQMENLRGRIGWTPTYSSFQDFVTAIRVVHGEEQARSWLEGVRALQPNAYPSNMPMLEALQAGEIDVALTNHYYVLRVHATAGAGAEQAVALHHFAQGDVGNLALVTGAGLLATAQNAEPGLRFLEYLLSAEGQARFVEGNNEYPVVRGAAVPVGAFSFDEALRLGPDLDFEQLRDLDATLRLMREVGLL